MTNEKLWICKKGNRIHDWYPIGMFEGQHYTRWICKKCGQVRSANRGTTPEDEDICLVIEKCGKEVKKKC